MEEIKVRKCWNQKCENDKVGGDEAKGRGLFNYMEIATNRIVIWFLVC